MHIKLKRQYSENAVAQHLLKVSQITGSGRDAGQLVRIRQFLIDLYVSRAQLSDLPDILCDEDLELLKNVLDYYRVKQS